MSGHRRAHLGPAAAALATAAILTSMVSSCGGSHGRQAASTTLPPPGITTGTAATAPTGSPGVSAVPVSLHTAVCGTWVLQQFLTASQLTKLTPELRAALATPGIQGFSMRVGWNEIASDFSILDQGLAIANAAHVSFSVRFMAGRYTPASVFAAGSPYYTLSDGTRVPIPFMANGTPNLAFQTAYLQLVAKLAAWARSNHVHLLHLSNYGQNYSEINYGIQIRQSPGFSQQNWLNAEYQLINGSLRYAGADLALELPMSGYGPVVDVVPSLVAHINQQVAAHPVPFFIEASGWNQSGFFSSTQEHNLDKVFTTSIQRGAQMINGGEYNWPALYQLAESIHTVFVEVYLSSFSGGGAATLDQQVQGFRSKACS